MLPRLEAGFLNRSLGCITTLVPLRIMTLAFIPGRKGISVNIFWKLYKSSMLPGEIDFQSTKSESYLDPIPFSRSKMHFASSKVVTWWSLKACMLYSGPIFAFYVDQYPTTCGEGGQRVICISSFCPPLEIFKISTH